MRVRHMHICATEATPHPSSFLTKKTRMPVLPTASSRIEWYVMRGEVLGTIRKAKLKVEKRKKKNSSSQTPVIVFHNLLVKVLSLSPALLPQSLVSWTTQGGTIQAIRAILVSHGMQRVTYT
ncbi:hypothetical protein TcWFU_004495 [Taenia crassiceps]|uniref:Uncharacterized protein n=1 Tax=Taenia crassiceps TaxID=6207 RepID=A0ABR4Q273_9CEST